MKLRKLTVIWLLALLATLGIASAQPGSNTSTEPTVRGSSPADEMRLEGEKRFRANCGRCHAAPEKFPPRMMATVIRHMRVRATITDEDMRLVLYYMTQ
jgi:mono/diheme cytochrome c family protein